MGCSPSKLDNEKVVQLCKDRKRFIEQAIEQRMRFSSGHMAYIQSLRRVAAALRDYVDEYEPHEFHLDSYTTTTTPPLTPEKKTGLDDPIQSQTISTINVNYLRSGGSPAVSVEERPISPVTMRIESYSPIHHFGIGGFFAMQSSPLNSSSFASTPNNRPGFPSPSPQTSSQWDFFWNPFTSLETYGYGSLDHTIMDAEIAGQRRVRQEGTPNLEEKKVELMDERSKTDLNCVSQTVTIIDHVETITETNTESIEVSKAQNLVKHEVSNQETIVCDPENKEETPGFTVYLNRRPVSMSEVIKDIETQFIKVSDSANEVSTMLEASRAPYSSISDELKGCHQSTLDRLYTWEKKLYGEVKSGERIRIAYEKKCLQLRSQEDPSMVDKTEAAIRDLHTQIKVSIQSMEAISKRIEALRDEELHPQLLELIQGLARMWKVMAESHKLQKLTIDEAKLLLATTAYKLAGRNLKSTIKLESELRNWRVCFESWITAQRSYVHALTGWLLKCLQCDSNTSKLPFSPPPIFGICIQWSRYLDTINEIPVINGLDFFSTGIGSLYTQKLREDSRRVGFSPEKKVEVVGMGKVEEVTTTTIEVAMKVLCAGMSVAISSLTEFTISSADGYAELVKQCESATWMDTTGTA